MTDAEIREYWEHTAAAAARDPSGEKQKLRIPGYAEQSNPLGLWGDDARFNRSGQKLIVFTMNSILHTSSGDWAIIWFLSRLIISIPTELDQIIYPTQEQK